MTTIVYVLMFLGTKAHNTTVDAYTESVVFETSQSCNNMKQELEVKLRKKFDKIQIDCKRKEVIK